MRLKERGSSFKKREKVRPCYSLESPDSWLVRFDTSSEKLTVKVLQILYAGLGRAVTEAAAEVWSGLIGPGVLVWGRENSSQQRKLLKLP